MSDTISIDPAEFSAVIGKYHVPISKLEVAQGTEFDEVSYSASRLLEYREACLELKQAYLVFMEFQKFCHEKLGQLLRERQELDEGICISADG